MMGAVYRAAYTTMQTQQSLRFLMQFPILLCLLFLTTTANANPLDGIPSGEYKADKTHISVVWKIRHLGLSNYIGRFTDIDASLDLDTTNYDKSTVNVSIKTASLQTGYPFPDKKDFDQELIEGTDWFNATQFPEITFRSTRFIPGKDNSARLEGELTLLGVSKAVVLDVTLNKAILAHPFAQKPALGFSATTTIQRKDWGLDKLLIAASNDVKIEIEAEFIQE